MRTPVLATLLGLSLVACAGTIDGGGGGDDDDIPATCGNNTVDPGETCDDGNNNDNDGCSAACTTEAVPRLDVAVDKPTVNTELGTSNMVTVTLTSSGGFTGQVSLAASVVDPNNAAITAWTVAVNPATVTVPANGTATAVVTLAIPSENRALAGSLKIAATSSATEGTFEATSEIAALNQVTIPMKLNNGQCEYPAAGTIKLVTGTKLRWFNNEAAGSGNRITIHVNGQTIPVNGATAPNQTGINHQSDPGSDPQSAYEATVTGGVTAPIEWYCHAPGPTVGGLRFEVVP